jgi:transcriptional regulator with XRE-family HTH domain
MSHHLSVIPKDHDERHRWMAMLLRASIAFQILTIRKARGWTQEELATRSGLSHQTIVRLEDMNGADPTVGTLAAVAKAFDCALYCRFSSWNEFVRMMAGTIPPSSYEAEREAGVEVREAGG